MTVRPERHEHTDACHAIHCYSCGVDEPGHDVYTVCGECGHVYPSARSLRRAYRRMAWQMMRSPYAPRNWFSDEWATGRLRQVWALVTIRAGRIYSCTKCSHDW